MGLVHLPTLYYNFFQPNVGKYSVRPMDPMGITSQVFFFVQIFYPTSAMGGRITLEGWQLANSDLEGGFHPGGVFCGPPVSMMKRQETVEQPSVCVFGWV